MKKILVKIKKRINYQIQNFKYDSQFSLYYATLRIIDDLFKRLHIYLISNNVHEVRDKWILNYLKKSINSVIIKYKNFDDIMNYEENAPIWVCWWTGEENAPDIVKQCIRSIRKHSCLHPVIFIDKNSYSSFIDIPEYMLKKVDAGKMGLAHLSDYIRVSLIEKYGGLWLDATIYCSNDIPEEYFELPFFTCKSEPIQCGFLSKKRWVTFVLGGWKGNIFYRFMKDAFEKYWSNEEVAIDYLFFDHLIEIARHEIPSILYYMNNVPINNLGRDDLQAAMNSRFCFDEWNKTISNETILYKLSWRENYFYETDDSRESIYSYFLNLSEDKL